MCFFLRKKTRLKQEKQNSIRYFRVQATSMDGGFGLLLPDESEEDCRRLVTKDLHLILF